MSGTTFAVSNIRERVLTSRTYYVRTDGSDSNTGLVDSAAGAFLTIQKAVDVVCDTLDVPRSITVTIQIRDGTYAAGATVRNAVGAGTFTILGNAGTPANVIVQNGFTFIKPTNGRWILSSMAIASTSNAITVSGGGILEISAIRFGTTTNAHIYAADNGVILMNGTANAITGDAAFHYLAEYGGVIKASVVTTTVTTAVAITTFAEARRNSSITAVSHTYTETGAVTGLQYNVTGVSVIDTAGAGANYFPGAGAGTAATGGVYI